MRVGRVAAVALAGGLSLGPGAAGAPTVKRARPPQIRPASQPASQPASLPVVASLNELGVYRLTQRGEHDLAIAEAAERWRVSPWLLRGLLYHESRLEAGAARSDTGARGIAQFTPSGAAAVGRLQRARGVPRREAFSYAMVLDPRVAIPAAAELLAYLRDVCGGLWCALAGYNTGNVRAVVTGFVRAVERHSNRFRTLAGLPPDSPLVRARPARRVQPRHRPES